MNLRIPLYYCLLLAACVKHAVNNSGAITIVTSGDTAKSQPTADILINIPANKSYSEPYLQSNPGVTIDQNADSAVVTNWASPVSVVWYSYVKPGKYKIRLNVMLPQGDMASLLLTSKAADSSFNTSFAYPFCVYKRKVNETNREQNIRNQFYILRKYFGSIREKFD